jgi:hypothetical protein
VLRNNPRQEPSVFQDHPLPFSFGHDQYADVLWNSFDVTMTATA